MTQHRGAAAIRFSRGRDASAIAARHRAATLLGLSALLFMGSLIACGGPPRQPNIVLVVLCSFRFNRLGVAGYPRSLTPFVDSLARRGAFFENAVGAGAWTKPAAASIVTGTRPGVHQLNDYYDARDVIAGKILRKKVLAAKSATLAELLREAGYSTIARVNNVHAGSFFGLTRGFADERTDPQGSTATFIGELEQTLASRHAEAKRSPFFFYLFTFEVHAPYVPRYESFRKIAARAISEEEYRDFPGRVFGEVMAKLEAQGDWSAEQRRDWIDLYDAKVLELDQALSALPGVLERAGELDNTVLIVTADHGERFFEHGRVDHGWFPDEPVVKIPLIVVDFRKPEPRRVKEVVRSIDLLPTIAELTGARVPAQAQGRSLLGALRGGVEDEPRVAWSVGPGYFYGLRRGRFKFRFFPNDQRWGLFDVEKDFLEERDLAAELPDLANEFKRIYQEGLSADRQIREALGEPEEAEMPIRLRDSLRALGYLGH